MTDEQEDLGTQVRDVVDAFLDKVFSEMERSYDRMLKDVRSLDKKKWDRMKNTLPDLKSKMREAAEEVRDKAIDRL